MTKLNLILILLTSTLLFFGYTMKVFGEPLTVELDVKNTIPLVEEISASLVDKTILALEANSQSPIYIYINSPGGDVGAGLQLVTYLQHTKKNIICIANFAASMAHAILESCPVRLGVPDNVLLQHHASTEASGKATEIEGQLKILRTMEGILDNLEAKRLGMPLATFLDLIEHPFITTGEESVKMNVIDAIVTVYCTPALYEAKRKLLISTPVGTVQGQASACPLINTPDVSGF